MTSTSQNKFKMASLSLCKIHMLQNMKETTHLICCYLSKNATVAFSGVMNYRRGSLKTSQFPFNVAVRLLSLVLVCILDGWGPKTLFSLFLLGSLTSQGMFQLMGMFQLIGKLQNIFWVDSKYRKVASSNLSCLEAHAGSFRLLIKGIFDPLVL